MTSKCLGTGGLLVVVWCGACGGGSTSGDPAPGTGGSSATLGSAGVGGAAAGSGGGPGPGAGGEAGAHDIGAGGSSSSGAAGTDFAEASSDLESAIDEHPTSDFTLILANDSGVFFTRSKGDSSPTKPYESASTSKWVASAVILRLMEQSTFEEPFALSTRPADLIDGWTDDPDDPRSQIELRQLLSFTSGLEAGDNDSRCTLLGTGTIETCVQNIYQEAEALGSSPGESFAYGSNHLQVAGFMAMQQLGVETWGEVFEAFQQETGLFPTAAFDLPNEDNPRLAGGMHWTAAEYMEFLGSLFARELLSPANAEAMFQDHTPEPDVAIEYSPTREAVDEVWHYGLGVWLECHQPAWNEACAQLRRFSSPGAYGAYPFIDFDRGFYGILAQQGGLGSFADTHDLYEDLRPSIDVLVALAP